LSVTIYEELRGLLEALEKANIEHALIGALAVAVWGAPRATTVMEI
jgi:hypothetical protein